MRYHRTYLADFPLAIRFFSRDTYGQPLSSTPSVPESGPLAPPSTKFDRRSSSPFEVKLSPLVAKRISLDAFGSPSPPRSDDDHSPDAVEQLKDAEDSFDLEISDFQGLADFHGTSLSTIKESPLSRGDQSMSADLASPVTSAPWRPPQRYAGPSSATQASISDQGISMRRHDITPDTEARRTRYYTPASSPIPRSGGLPLPAESPFVPSRSDCLPHPPLSPESPYVPRRHLSAPPVPLTMALMDAQKEHAAALQRELFRGEAVIGALEAETRQLRDALEEETREKAQAVEETIQHRATISDLETELTSIKRDLSERQLEKEESESNSMFVTPAASLMILSHRTAGNRLGAERGVVQRYAISPRGSRRAVRRYPRRTGRARLRQRARREDPQRRS